MSIEHAILGLLSWRPLSGYDLKKIFEESPLLYWSGNNNEIYRTLVKLHKQGLVTREVQLQESLPARKIYSITPPGQEALRQWALSSPEPPQLRHAFLIQLVWGDTLTPAELDAQLTRYEDEVNTQLLMARTQTGPPDPTSGRSLSTFLNPTEARSPRERFLWSRLQSYWITFYQAELDWVRTLRTGLRELEESSTNPA